MDVFGAAVPDTQAPTAAITNPTDGETFAVGADFDITVDVNDDVQIVSVTLFADGAEASEDNGEPWGPWPVTRFSARSSSSPESRSRTPSPLSFWNRFHMGGTTTPPLKPMSEVMTRPGSEKCWGSVQFWIASQVTSVPPAIGSR